MQTLTCSARNLTWWLPLGLFALSACEADFPDTADEHEAYLVADGDDAGIAATTLALAEDGLDFNFGAHAVDQCARPVATISNTAGSMTHDNLILFREPDGSCRSKRGYCVGDCVRVEIKADGGKVSRGINVIAGLNLPNPSNCSEVAVKTNYPGASWDFTAAGACGKGARGNGIWHNCLVHDVCVWARCTDHGLIAGLNPGDLFTKHPRDDQFCGKAFADASKDFILANVPLSCLSDRMCPEGTDCKMGACLQRGLPEGSPCVTDSDCEGYCQLLKCYDGSKGDRCRDKSDCQPGLTCIGVRPNGHCQEPKNEGAMCDADSDCKGYCQFLRCWDGSKGDKCRTTSDCQKGLTCKKRCAICAQKTCQ